MKRTSWASLASGSAMLAGMLISLAVAAGCSGPLQGTATPTRFYLLQCEASPEKGLARDTKAPILGTLGIGPVGLPEYLKRPQVVTRDGSRKIALSVFDHWGEPLDAGVARVLTTALVRHQQVHHMSIQPRAFHDTLEYRLWIDINRFDGAPGGELILAGRWSIRNASRGAPADWHDFFQRQLVDGESIEALVAAHSAALERLAADLAVAIKRRYSP